MVTWSALRLPDGAFLIIASSLVPQAQAIEAYARRREIETLFGHLKPRSFNYEDTPLVHAERLSKVLGLLALAFAWTYPSGELRHKQHPILF